jgi:hypothetical protein
MKLSTRDVFVQMPKDFVVPSRGPIDALHLAIAGVVPVPESKGKTTVTVRGKPYDISTRQKSKSIWVASGGCNGAWHSTEDRTEGAAVKQWQDWAEYRGRS